MEDMKRTLLAIITLGISLSVSAQSLTIPGLNRTPWGSIESSIIQSQGTVENTNGASTINVKVRRITVDTVPGTQNYFCWEQCYEPPTSISPTSMSILPGDRVNQFYADYKPNGISGVSTLIYCFYDETNEADSVCATVRFSASPTGVEDVFMGNESGIGQVYPNPVRRTANINYALAQGWRSAEVNVYSMLGSLVKKVALKEDQGTLKLSVSDLPSGMYFYTLTVNDHDISTKKMMVTK